VPAPQRRRGLTLIEVAVVLALLGLLVTLAAPSFAGALARQRLKSTAETLAADLVAARHEAAQRGLPMYLALRGGSDWCWAVATSPGCGCNGVAACRLKAAQASEAPGVTLEGGAEIVLDPAGVAAPATIRLAGAGGARLRIDLSPLGRVRICAPGRFDGYPAC
jgi:type IV fimbrial biogenesis protein FimT